MKQSAAHPLSSLRMMARSPPPPPSLSSFLPPLPMSSIRHTPRQSSRDLRQFVSMNPMPSTLPLTMDHPHHRLCRYPISMAMVLSQELLFWQTCEVGMREPLPRKPKMWTRSSGRRRWTGRNSLFHNALVKGANLNGCVGGTRKCTLGALASGAETTEGTGIRRQVLLELALELLMK